VIRGLNYLSLVVNLGFEKYSPLHSGYLIRIIPLLLSQPIELPGQLRIGTFRGLKLNKNERR
jgi:hypothetical protein